MSLLSVLFGAAVLACLIYLVLKLPKMGRRDKDLPPGPRTTFVVGNALDFPTSFPHIKFFEWCRRYGDIFSLKILDRTVIVISSAAAVKHILDSNGARTGNRPLSKLIERVTNGSILAFESMDKPIWKHGRQAIHSFFNKDNLETHQKVQQEEYSQLLYDTLKDPPNLYHHVQRTAASVMTTLLYGVKVAEYKGSVAETYFRGTKLVNQASDPGAHPPIDLFWPLQYVPKRWTYWKRLADSAREMRDDLYGSLYAQCELRAKSKNIGGCFIESLILNQAKPCMTQHEIISTGAVMMDAGAETTAAFLNSFILSMVNNPLAQKRARDEIDAVVGSDRWPILSDYDNLPYIRAIGNEVHRFRTTLPLALPHVSTEELHYQGYRIPKDSIIFMNTHGIYHDPDLFNDPHEFRPERFLASKFGTKPGADTKGFRDNFAFGAGRRICPGESMARRSIALATMNLLWAFEFKKDTSGTGNQDISAYAAPGLELAPKEFTCDVFPRSAVKAEMIQVRYLKSLPKKASMTP